MKITNVLFVCMGNICRSPTAEAVFRHLVLQNNLSDTIMIDSAGTHAYHIGESPDSRSQAAALQRGMDMSKQRARKVKIPDLVKFDYILAMDQDNYRDLRALATNAQQYAKIHLLMDFAPHWNKSEVPDPYYGGQNGFEQVLDQVEAASEGLLTTII